jgi:hypothetical protein
MARNPDPKHGRWILPLIITAMVVLTFTFVNSLEPAEREEGTTTIADPAFPTTPTSSTTTLPPTTAAFLVTLDVLETQAISFRDEMTRINDDWEARRLTFGETRQALVDLQGGLETWEEQVANLADVPPELAEGHVALVLESGQMPEKVEDVILGLEAPDDGTLRRTAVEQYASEMQDVLDSIATIRSTAEATAGTTPDDTTDTTEGDDA